MVSRTGPEVLPSGDPEAGVLPGVWKNSITCAIKSTGVSHSQQTSPRQDIAPVILLSRVSLRPEPYSEPGGGPVPLS